jgi:hypothetical protein
MNVGSNEIFVVGLGVLSFLMLYFGFRLLPLERWQIIATIPLYKSEAGHWHAANLTTYGLVTAFAYVISVALTFILLGALSVPLVPLFAAAIALLAFVIPASRLVARWVEKKRYTFTIGGASFVGIVVTPWILAGANAIFGAKHAIPLIPSMAAFAIAYAFGEGIGRLACISFGCCYGKPVSSCNPPLRQLFQRWHVVFHGKTKKIAYEGRLEGERVVPIQAMTASLYVGAGLVAAWLYLRGAHTAALLVALITTQLWRVFSEALRADYRGGRKVSIYQILAVLSIIYIVAVTAAVPATTGLVADAASGLRSLWDPAMILFLLFLGVGTFVYAGRSMVTQALVSIHVCEDRI